MWPAKALSTPNDTGFASSANAPFILTHGFPGSIRVPRVGRCVSRRRTLIYGKSARAGHLGQRPGSSSPHKPRSRDHVATRSAQRNNERVLSNDERSSNVQMTKKRKKKKDRPAVIRHSSLVIDCHSDFVIPAGYRTWLGLVTGGRPLRNSACCRSASRRCSASRDACSGSGPGDEQPKKTRVNVGTRNIKVASFFIE